MVAAHALTTLPASDGCTRIVSVASAGAWAGSFRAENPPDRAGYPTSPRGGALHPAPRHPRRPTRHVGGAGTGTCAGRTFDKVAADLPRPEHPSTNGDAALQELLGGKFDEMSTTMNYTFQSSTSAAGPSSARSMT